MEAITFSYNWNKKLSCNCFTSLRLYNPVRFFPGAIFEIILQEGKTEPKRICNAKIMFCHKIKISDLSETQCYLDTGYGKSETTAILKRMYKNKGIDIFNADFHHILFKRLSE